MFASLTKNAETSSHSNQKTSTEKDSVLDITSNSDVSNETANLTQKNQPCLDILNHHDLLKLIFKKVDAMEDHLIKMNVEIVNLRSERVPAMGEVSKEPTSNIDLEVLNRLGLPSKNKAELDALEDKLKNNEEFKKEIVSG